MKPKEIIELESELGFELTETENLDDIYNAYLLNQEKVTGLTISFYDFTSFYFLPHFFSLESINLVHSQIPDTIFLINLAQLTNLYFEYNQVTNLFLSDFINLISIKLYNNTFYSIYLDNLNNLTTLQMSYNTVYSISLVGLINLMSIDLNGNNIKNINILNLINLLELNVANNAISNISALRAPNLISLDLSYNQISSISINFLNHFVELHNLNLQANPIQNIPKELFEYKYNCLSEVRHYLEDLEESQTFNKEVKVILIGNGSVGKTQIAKRLAEQENFIFENLHNSTHSVTLLQRKLKNLQLNIWDMAGQDIYHATHRLFMQTRALFVLVWDIENEKNDFHEWEGKKYKNEKLQYWLEYATCFGQGSPILVVQNKVDTKKECENKNLEFTESYYKDKYPIVEFVQTSAKTGYNFDVLEYWLAESFDQNEKLKQELLLDIPTSWATIRTGIRNLQAKRQKILTLSDFKVLCEQQEIAKSENTLLAYFHDTNVFYYKKNYFNNQIIINQAWVIEAIYAVLDRQNFYFRTGKIKKGVLQYVDLQELWKNNSNEERKLFIDFMLSSELCFETTKNYQPLQERIFVVPQLLPENKPKEITTYWEKEKAIGKIIQEIDYSFLPTVYMQLFIVRANTFAKVENMWQSGILLEWNNCYAVIEADYGSIPKKIMIYASPNSKFFVEKIVEELENIADKTQVKAQKPQKGLDAVIEGEKYLRGLAGLKKNDNFSNNQNNNTTMYGKDKEVLGIEEINYTLQEKKTTSETPSIHITINNNNENMSKFENIGNVSNSGNSTNTNTNTNNNSLNQSFDFTTFAQQLPNLKRELNVLQKDYPELVELKEIKRLLSDIGEVEPIIEKKDEKAIKEATFWSRLGNFATWLYGEGKKVLNPANILRIGKSLKEIDQLAKVSRIETGFDFANYGTE